RPARRPAGGHRVLRPGVSRGSPGGATPLLLAAACGALLTLALPATGWWPAAAAMAGPYAAIANARRPRRAFAVGFWTGLPFFAVYLAWLPASLGDLLGPAFWAVFPLLVLALSCVWGGTAWLSWAAAGGGGRPTLWSLPGAWAARRARSADRPAAAGSRRRAAGRGRRLGRRPRARVGRRGGAAAPDPARPAGAGERRRVRARRGRRPRPARAPRADPGRRGRGGVPGLPAVRPRRVARGRRPRLRHGGLRREGAARGDLAQRARRRLRRRGQGLPGRGVVQQPLLAPGRRRAGPLRQALPRPLRRALAAPRLAAVAVRRPLRPVRPSAAG